MRIRLILCTLCLTIAVATVIGVAGPAAPALAQESDQGCAHCHEDLAEALPEDHPRITIAEITYCLPCHGAEGAARGLVWITHLNHYGQEDFPGDCLSCHAVAGGEMVLVGMTQEQVVVEEDEATPEPTVTPTPTLSATPTGAAAAAPTARPTRTPKPTPTPRPLDEDWALEMTEYFQSWASSEYGDHTHALASVTCEQCHGTFFPEKAPAMELCLRCHGSYAHLAELTHPEDEGPNPHDSHLGELRCDTCHRGHEESVVLCLDCHLFEMEMPEWDTE